MDVELSLPTQEDGDDEEDAEPWSPLTPQPSFSEASRSTPASTSTTASERPARRRLATKRPRPPEFRIVPRSLQDVFAVGAESGNQVGPTWEGFTPARDRRMYWRVRYRLKRWAEEQQHRHGVADRRSAERQFYQRILGTWPRQDQRMGHIIAKALRLTDAPQSVWAWARQVWKTNVDDTAAAESRSGRWLQASQSLMTWHGDWGLLDDSCCEDVNDDWRELVARVSKLPRVLALWDEFREFVSALIFKFFLVDWAASLEICMDTWQEERVVRLHVHFCWKASSVLPSRQCFGAIFLLQFLKCNLCRKTCEL